MNKDQGKQQNEDGSTKVDSDDSGSQKVTFEETIKTIHEQLSNKMVEDIYNKKFDFYDGKAKD